MTKFNTRLATAVATAAVILGAVAPAAFADTTVTISHNGAASNNAVEVTNTTNTSVTQTNDSTVVTDITSKANTGNNSASFNTGGDTSISTGNATSKVTVGVGGSDNTAVVTDPCGCNSTTNVSVGNNGAGSSNGVGVTVGSWFSSVQANISEIVTSITSKVKTGNNSSSYNTDGSSTIMTGTAKSHVNVTVTGSSNTLVH